jgi:hypothetical protein
MLISCLIKSIATSNDGVFVRDTVKLHNAVFDVITGTLRCPNAASPTLNEKLKNALSVDILIGDHEYQLTIDPLSKHVSDQLLREYREEFQTLHQAQRILGIDGSRAFH